jgi:hypothetical protein
MRLEMNRFTVLFVILVFALTMAWAQAPAAQPAVAAPAATSSISGCMTQSFGIFTVPDNGKTWSVKGTGTSLWNYDNHVVKVTGLADPKSASPVLYAQSVQDTGQPCGSAATASAAAPANGTATTTAATGAANGTATGAGAPAATTSTATTSAPASAAAEPQQQPGGGIAQNTSPNAPVTAQAPATQPGTTGVTNSAPQTSENKGTPEAGSPQAGAIASNAAAAPAENYSTFNGCLVGSINDYQFKSNGKTYRLQGNTSQLNSMFKHTVEITGEDFNGKAIQVNGARDLGTSCK